MVFKVCGLVKWKGRKIANGVDGRFETNDPRIIERLKILGFKEIAKTPDPVTDNSRVDDETREEEVQAEKTEEVDTIEKRRRGRPRK